MISLNAVSRVGEAAAVALGNLAEMIHGLRVIKVNAEPDGLDFGRRAGKRDAEGKRGAGPAAQTTNEALKYGHVDV